MSSRDLARYSEHQVTQFDSISDFLGGAVPQGISSVSYGGGLLDLLVKAEDSADVSVVAFHAATKTTATKPVFSGLGITEGLRANVIFVSDPTLDLYPHVTNGWFAGNEHQPLQQDLPGVLRHIFAKLGTKHVIFYGPSCGGFASLFYASHFPGSLAIPTNPQTIIGNFGPDAVLRYVSAGFEQVATVDAAVDALTRHGVTQDLCSLYADGVQHTVAYMQNIPDVRHVRGHMLPFHAATQSPGADSVRYLFGHWGPGHHAPPKPLIRDTLSRAVAAQGDWGGMLAESGFGRSLPEELAG